MLKINGKEIEFITGENVWHAAKRAGFFIPGLCSHPDFSVKANCRVCVVEIEGRKNLAASCSTETQDGMVIMTETERVQRSRNLNLEMIFAEHVERCPTCVWRFNCKLLEYAGRYKIRINTLKDRKSNRPVYRFANAVEIDSSQCIDCRNCVDACSKLQKINYLEIKGKGRHQEVCPTEDKAKDCIYCGQCAVHCPVSATQEQTHWEEVEMEMKNEKKIVVAQFAPSIRVSIGEEFGLPYGEVVTGQLVGGLKQLGFDYVFDVNFAADITAVVEAEELAERIKDRTTQSHPSPLPAQRDHERKQNGGNNALPMFTASCPAWIKYVEFYRPDLIPNLTASRSPQVHGGGIVKTYWAKKMNIDPKRIVVVSIMPCTSKKFEADRPEMVIIGGFPVDYVLTTRELAFMLKKNRIDLAKLKAGQADSPFGEHTGAAAIYGASGGVMESALRTAADWLKKKGEKINLEIKAVRGLEGVKEAEIAVSQTRLRALAINGIGNVDYLLANMDKYDYVEVMACPGGCIGGGGQPIPTTPEIRRKRDEALHEIDKGKKKRMAHENEEVLKVKRWLEEEGLAEEVLYTKHKKRK